MCTVGESVIQNEDELRKKWKQDHIYFHILGMEDGSSFAVRCGGRGRINQHNPVCAFTTVCSFYMCLFLHSLWRVLSTQSKSSEVAFPQFTDNFIITYVTLITHFSSGLFWVMFWTYKTTINLYSTNTRRLIIVSEKTIPHKNVDLLFLGWVHAASYHSPGLSWFLLSLISRQIVFISRQIVTGIPSCLQPGIFETAVTVYGTTIIWSEWKSSMKRVHLDGHLIDNCRLFEWAYSCCNKCTDVGRCRR